MPKKQMMVEWDDGAELSESRKKPGDKSPLTRDADGNLGQVTLTEIDEDDEARSRGGFDGSSSGAAGWDDDEDDDEPTFWQAVAADVISQIVDALIEEAKPHLRRWWTDRARPGLSAKARNARAKLSRSKNGKEEITDAESEIIDHGPGAPVPSARRVTLTSDEARERLVAALVARAMSDEQLQILLNAEIVDADGATASIEQFAPKRIEAQVHSILADNPSHLEDLVLGLVAASPAPARLALADPRHPGSGIGPSPS